MKVYLKLFSIMLCLAMLLPLSACANNSSTDKQIPENRQYTFWFRAGDAAYTNYDENPGIEYLKTIPYGKDEKGKDRYIDIKTFVPVSGTEADSFNTLIATGDYMDVMDTSAYSGDAKDLYESGIALDITEYVEKFMPNYQAFLNANPELKATATNEIDGQRRYIQIYLYADALPDMWGGYMYRRDWIVKYGTNPKDGSAFKGQFEIVNADGTVHPDSWTDNVVFPSGGADPVYISDWEWMFGIFEKALADLGISDGYCLSLSYPGFQATGDLVCAFGGGNPIWHKTPENEIVFGGKSDNFRIYLQAMNTWYKNGWIDKSFAEHTSDMFYMIDSAKIFSGKVGLWYGTNANLGARLFKADDPYLDGIAVSVAAQPINDIYGTAAQQNVTPFALYQTSQENLAYVITNKAADKDIETLFTFLDSLYAGDGAIVRSFGLSKEQYEVTKNKFMTENGFTEGAYSIVTDEDGVTRYQLYQSVIDAGLDGAVKAQRLPGLELISLLSIANYHKGYRANISRYVQYRNTGWLYNSFTGQLTQENSKTYAKTNTNISEFMAKNVPPFIQGKKDPYNDEDWNSYVKAINKYNPDKITDIFQQLADSMYGG